MAYEVHVDDNFHLFDKSKPYTNGEYATYEEALAVSRKIVETSSGQTISPA